MTNYRKLTGSIIDKRRRKYAIDEMRNCPRCNGDPEIEQTCNGAYSIYCPRCKAFGAYGLSMREAVGFWNYDIMDETEGYRQPFPVCDL